MPLNLTGLAQAIVGARKSKAERDRRNLELRMLEEKLKQAEFDRLARAQELSQSNQWKMEERDWRRQQQEQAAREREENRAFKEREFGLRQAESQARLAKSPLEQFQAREATRIQSRIDEIDKLLPSLNDSNDPVRPAGTMQDPVTGQMIQTPAQPTQRDRLKEERSMLGAYLMGGGGGASYSRPRTRSRSVGSGGFGYGGTTSTEPDTGGFDPTASKYYDPTRLIYDSWKAGQTPEQAASTAKDVQSAMEGFEGNKKQATVDSLKAEYREDFEKAMEKDFSKEAYNKYYAEKMAELSSRGYDTTMVGEALNQLYMEKRKRMPAEHEALLRAQEYSTSLPFQEIEGVKLIADDLGLAKIPGATMDVINSLFNMINPLRRNQTGQTGSVNPNRTQLMRLNNLRQLPPSPGLFQ